MTLAQRRAAVTRAANALHSAAMDYAAAGRTFCATDPCTQADVAAFDATIRKLRVAAVAYDEARREFTGEPSR